jgi:membrane-associated phospholipid phosphatase
MVRANSVRVVTGAACALAFVAIGWWVRNHLPAVDRWGLDSAITDAGSTATRVATIASTVGVLFGFAILAILAILAFRDRRRLVRHLVLLLACATPFLLQNVFRRPGPPGQAESFSYPSGHASVACAIAATSIVIAATSARRWLRRVVALQAVAVLVTMASRVALSEHYVTDVVGAALGVASIALLATALVSPFRVAGTPGSVAAQEK